jgi:hypothetical protein
MARVRGGCAPSLPPGTFPAFAVGCGSTAADAADTSPGRAQFDSAPAGCATPLKHPRGVRHAPQAPAPGAPRSSSAREPSAAAGGGTTKIVARMSAKKAALFANIRATILTLGRPPADIAPAAAARAIRRRPPAHPRRLSGSPAPHRAPRRHHRHPTRRLPAQRSPPNPAKRQRAHRGGRHNVALVRRRQPPPNRNPPRRPGRSLAGATVSTTANPSPIKAEISEPRPAPRWACRGAGRGRRAAPAR